MTKDFVAIKCQVLGVTANKNIMINPDLQNYIAQARAAGQTDEQIWHQI